MSRGTLAGVVIVVIVVGAGVVYGWKLRPDPSQATLFVTVVMCGITAIYALLTFGILHENKSMAQASVDSTTLMERSLRFSYAPHLLYSTLSTKDAKLQAIKGVTPIDNADYQTALKQDFEGQQQAEFVFAIISNEGSGSATNLNVDAEYMIWDSSNPNKNYTVKKVTSIQFLESKKSVALCIFVSKVPTADDRVELTSATLTASDIYRDALGESPQKKNIRPSEHHTTSEPGCVVQMK
ncbi:MAG TPA: hypothetical protein VII23_25200 [Terriglobales bacterium]